MTTHLGKRPPSKLLTVGHSYVVALNRRLADEIARQSDGAWDVTVAAPLFVHGDLRPIPMEPPRPDGVPVVGVPVRFSHRIHLMNYGRTLKRLIQSNPWDLIHIWEEPYIFSGYQLGRWAGDVPHIFYTNQNLFKRYPFPFSRFERSAIRGCSGWVAGGRLVETAMLGREEYAAKPRRTITLGVDTEIFRPDRTAGAAVREKLGWKNVGPPVVGYLGRFVLEKGFNVLLPALEKLTVDFRVLLVGGGAMKAELKAWGAKFGDRVRIVTGVKHGEVPAYLNAMDLLVAPSQTTLKWREQLGRMLLEAFAVGIPVVGSDSGEIPYVIGDAGVVLPEADIDAWAAAISRLIESPAERERLGYAGRTRALEVFSWPVIARQHIDFFDEVLSFRS